MVGGFPFAGEGFVFWVLEVPVCPTIQDVGA
jgi:hypothetical protein